MEKYYRIKRYITPSPTYQDGEIYQDSKKFHKTPLRLDSGEITAKELSVGDSATGWYTTEYMYIPVNLVDVFISGCCIGVCRCEKDCDCEEQSKSKMKDFFRTAPIVEHDWCYGDNIFKG